MAKIVSLGSALQDIYLIDHDDFVGGVIPGEAKEEKEIFKKLEIGTKADIDRIMFETGGGGTNSAVTFARGGHEVAFIGNIGRDSAGEAILACLDEENIDSSYVYFAPHKKTGCSVILLDTKSGERTILTHRGASAKFDNLNPADLEEIKPDWMYITSLRGDMKTLEKFLKKAQELGVKVMWNPGKLEIKEGKKLLSLLKYVEVLLVNKKEAGEIVGGTNLRELIEKLKGYCPVVIITDGGMGAIATDGNEILRAGLYEDCVVKDTTGAGDSFGSGFLSAYAAGKSFEKALIFASANSTSVVGRLGAKPGILTGKEKLHQMPIQKL
ncbi:carbohydrate kinase family protein [Candidatus Saccharibacteria bacterium]|nr:carbohydrate kinase family protein [Candidatus Saccharibacteria bacterium]